MVYLSCVWNQPNSKLRKVDKQAHVYQWRQFTASLNMMAKALILTLWHECEMGVGHGEGDLQISFPGLEVRCWTFGWEIKAMSMLTEKGFHPCRKLSSFCLRDRLFILPFHFKDLFYYILFILYYFFILLFFICVTQRPSQHIDLAWDICVHWHAQLVICVEDKASYKRALQCSKKKQSFWR